MCIRDSIEGEDSDTYHKRKVATFLKACEVWNRIDGSTRSRIRLTANATYSDISVIPVGEVCSPKGLEPREEHAGEYDMDRLWDELGLEQDELSNDEEELDSGDLLGYF